MYSGVGLSGYGGLGAELTWMGKDPTLVKFQLAVNRELSSRGYKTIGTDGQLGPATCGAWAWLGSLEDASWADNPDLQIVSEGLSNNYALCKAYSYPVKVGATVAVDPTTFVKQVNVSAPYLWGVADPRVSELQSAINQQLDGMGYNKIPVSGVIDAATCGAAKFAKEQWGFEYLTTHPFSEFGCQAYTLPTKKAAAGPVGPGPIGPVGPRPPAPAASSQAWMVGGLIGAAVLTGLYVATKKKRRAA